MSISPEDSAAGQAACARVKSYELWKHRRLAIYLIPGIWLISSLARCEARTNSWNIFQLIFWFFVFIAITIFDLKRKVAYTRDLALLTQLRKLYGEAISFEIKNAKPDSGPSAEDSIGGFDRWRQRGLKPLFEFCIILLLLYGLKILIDWVWPMFERFNHS